MLAVVFCEPEAGLRCLIAKRAPASFLKMPIGSGGVEAGPRWRLP